MRVTHGEVFNVQLQLLLQLGQQLRVEQLQLLTGREEGSQLNTSLLTFDP